MPEQKFFSMLSGRRLKRTFFLVVVPLAAICVALYLYAAGGRYVSTNNAYVKANVIIISTEVSGRVTSMLVADNQAVEANDILLQLDSSPLEIALNRARAQMAVIRTELESLRADYGETVVQAQLAEDKVRYLDRRYKRQRKLLKQGLSSEEKHDEARHDLQVARREVKIIEQRVQRVLAQLAGNKLLPADQHPRYLAAQTTYDQAAVDLKAATIRAPASGVVSNMKLQVGEFAQAGKPIFTLIENQPIWIEANLKETQLTHILPGQQATIVADAYPDKIWESVISSIAPATGAEFSILPPQNASGNWVKVVQRIPINLAITNQAGDPQLRAGMTVLVRIDTRRKRELSGQIRDLLGERDVLELIRDVGQKAMVWRNRDSGS
ncbi:MAG: HlyD family secretion protein [Acidiferrobacteraceae bacterium]|jgi:membrane fusion protein (multidrug efflux system)|nr:HlyD family secretion protein [Acidiferrobacteraceae bacterium]MBT3638744.1 HlyD family secretion protein [Acidiferrobacteraceae bacterium]MBT4404128.1 HlyD family secretion protein [Acidiferrobacteraceae bacterium]MBT5981622.1 HlyD family secretion protein [Acidiferrobacteraceae bacterium]MBT6732114.1 HlyD family secretion protein [Acidiferrobacteraceae bacterium]